MISELATWSSATVMCCQSSIEPRLEPSSTGSWHRSPGGKRTRRHCRTGTARPEKVPSGSFGSYVPFSIRWARAIA